MGGLRRTSRPDRPVLLLFAMRAVWLCSALLLLAAEVGATRTRRHGLLITVAGLRGDYVADADRYGLQIPTLRRLMRGGAFSARTLSVFPTLTVTAHTSIVTGTGAGRHGILGNNRFDPST